MTSTLLAEDLLLLLLDDETGRPIVDSTKLPRALAGAALLELALPGSVRLTEAGEDVKKGRLVAVAKADRDTDPITRGALDLIRESRPMTPQSAIEKLTKGLQHRLTARLLDKRWLREEHDKIFGIFPRTSWPATDNAHKTAVLRELEVALIGTAAPAPRTAALVSLLVSVDAVPKIFPNADPKAIKNRAKEIADGEWAGAAVRKAIDSVNTAIIAAVVASTAAGVISSGAS